MKILSRSRPDDLAVAVARVSSRGRAPARRRRTVDSHSPEARPSRAVPETFADRARGAIWGRIQHPGGCRRRKSLRWILLLQSRRVCDLRSLARARRRRASVL